MRERSGLRVFCLLNLEEIVRGGSALMGTIVADQASSTGSGHCMLGVGAKRVQWDTGGETTNWGVSLGGSNDRACAEERGCSIAGAVGSSLVGTCGSSLVGYNGSSEAEVSAQNGGFESKAKASV
jgi:hypothetical protein